MMCFPRGMHGGSTSIVAILNATAGGASDATERVSAAFAAQGAAAQVLTAATGDALQDAARTALAAGASAVAAGGGDGTVSAVASVLAGTGVSLGILPLGTLNHFAKDLGLPLDLNTAVEVILKNRPASVDAAEVNGRIFVNNSSLGLYPMLVQQRELHQSLGRGKWPAFVWAGLSALRWYPFLTLRIETAGRKLLRRTPFLFIGNNVYDIQGFRIGSRVSISEGQMCIYGLHRTGRLALARLALSALFGRLHNQRDFDSLCATEVWIDSPRRRLHVAVDGEVTVMRPPLHYLIRPGALRVLLP
ncbi:MAG TPA: diacylglycerol kinase family protein [Bryobacteraceae bacterium]|nr:diacylglycerol kinase family protein [Bryobacteraceae bacterium]